MDIHISEDLAKIVPVEEGRRLAEWLSKYEPADCTEAHLTSSSFKPVDEAGLATGSAVLSLKFKNMDEQRHNLCYIYSNGDNPGQVLCPWEGPHICLLHDLHADDDDDRDKKLIEEAIEKQA